MKEGLWKRFKDLAHHILFDSLTLEKSYDYGEGIDESCNFIELRHFRRVTYSIKFSIPLFYEIKADALFRWFIRKLHKAIDNYE